MKHVLTFMLFPSGYCVFVLPFKVITGSTYRNTDLESELKLTYIMTAKMLLLQITTAHVKSQFVIVFTGCYWVPAPNMDIPLLPCSHPYCLAIVSQLLALNCNSLA
jgi:hypothetical protein